MHIPKKKFGQNFLVNKEAKNKLAEVIKFFVENSSAENILEIGPGLGDLTEISCNFLPVVAVEIDEDIVNKMNDQFKSQFSQVHPSKLYLGDIYLWQRQIIKQETTPTNNLLTENEYIGPTQKPEFTNIVPPDFKNFYSNQNWVLISNLPYNLGSRILVDMALLRPDLAFLVILQEEVVDKLVHLEKHFTFFGAWLNCFYSFKKQLVLPRHYFSPQPNVTSALVLATTKKLPEFLNSSVKRVVALETLKKLFAFPSKTIYNNLRQMNYKDHEIQELLRSVNLSISARLNKDNYLPLLHKILGVDKV
jgi:16S rRNA (adenine1518-N6/adenine1519-N6)-dimethyltransferase